jgi:DNA polymerase-3 subunit delta
VKLSGAAVDGAVDRPDRNCRFYLFYGPDESGSRALAQRLLRALRAEKFAISAAEVRDDPASLADEAGALALFGGPRAIWIEPAGDEITKGIASLLGAASVESPVVAIGGGLRKTSSLVKMAESDPRAAAAISYVPEGANANRMVIDLGRAEGLSIAPDVADRISEFAAANRAIVASELVKYALFLDSAPDRVRTLDHATIDLLGADSSEADLGRLGDFALTGNGRDLLDELQKGTISSGDSVSVAKAMLRRLVQVAPMRARVDSGERVDGVMASAGKSLFYKDQATIQMVLTVWQSARLAALIDRSSKLEHDLMLSDQPEVALLGEELITIARAARARR